MQPISRTFVAVSFVLASCLPASAAQEARTPTPYRAATADCNGGASPACYFALELPDGGGTLHYFASSTPVPASSATASAPSARPTRAVIALHGHPRDANKTFDAVLDTATHEPVGDVLVVAPVFQVDSVRAARCSTPGVPGAVAGDALWTCGSWMEGGRADTGTTAFAALDALVAEVARQWPSLRSITLAGFSAGAQMVQHYVGFSHARQPAPAGLAIRYVIADPGSWLYFDSDRIAPPAEGRCPNVSRWKYGTDGLPDWLGRDAAAARQRYAQADIAYLEGELDTGDAPGTYYRILDKSCAAMAQGADRLQRGRAFVAYDREKLAPGRQRPFAVVPGCAHDVRCVFAAPVARALLLGRISGP